MLKNLWYWLTGLFLPRKVKKIKYRGPTVIFSIPQDDQQNVN